MYYMAFNVSFWQKDIFKEEVKNAGLKARYDYRQKWWEVYGNAKIAKKAAALKSSFTLIKEWSDSLAYSKYKESVYRRGK